MTPSLLRRAGEALYGERWQSALAEALGVSDRSIRYWMDGRAIPSGVAEELRDILRVRRRLLDKLDGELAAAPFVQS